jgi:hypothetical protein
MVDHPVEPELSDLDARAEAINVVELDEIIREGEERNGE